MVVGTLLGLEMIYRLDPDAIDEASVVAALRGLSCRRPPSAAAVRGRRGPALYARTRRTRRTVLQGDT